MVKREDSSKINRNAKCIFIALMLLFVVFSVIFNSLAIATNNGLITQDSSGGDGSNESNMSSDLILEVDAGGQYNGTVNIPINFNGSATGGESPYRYEWDFGDGSDKYYDDDGRVTHTYTTAGSYTATLTVTDYCHKMKSDNATVTINSFSTNLNADAQGPYNGTINIPVQFNGSATGGAAPYRFLWDFGDGTQSRDAITTHIYNTTRVYNVTLTVKDDNEDINTNYTTVTIVRNKGLGPTLEPIANASGPYYGTVNIAVEFNGSATGGVGLYNFTWLFGDGKTGFGEKPTHTYNSARTYRVTLTVTDSNGESDSDETFVIISPTQISDDKNNDNPPADDDDTTDPDIPNNDTNYDNDSVIDEEDDLLDNSTDLEDTNKDVIGDITDNEDYKDNEDETNDNGEKDKEENKNKDSIIPPDKNNGYDAFKIIGAAIGGVTSYIPSPILIIIFIVGLSLLIFVLIKGKYIYINKDPESTENKTMKNPNINEITTYLQVNK